MFVTINVRLNEINMFKPTVCMLVINTNMVNNLSFLFDCTLVGRPSDALITSTLSYIYSFSLVAAEAF